MYIYACAEVHFAFPATSIASRAVNPVYLLRSAGRTSLTQMPLVFAPEVDDEPREPAEDPLPDEPPKGGRFASNDPLPDLLSLCEWLPAVTVPAVEGARVVLLVIFAPPLVCVDATAIVGATGTAIDSSVFCLKTYNISKYDEEDVVKEKIKRFEKRISDGE